MKPLILLAIVAVILVIFSLIFELIKSAGPRYAAKNLLTDNEKEFYLRLKRALTGYEVFPQVAMGAVLNPAVGRNDRSYYKIRGTFSQKIIDFVVCDGQSLKVIAIVELDDCTHNARRDQQRDNMLESAGYHVIRWDCRRKPTIDEIQKKMGMI